MFACMSHHKITLLSFAISLLAAVPVRAASLQQVSNWGASGVPSYIAMYIYVPDKPRIQLWHGDSDETIHPNNFTEAIKEWTNVLGLDATPTSTTTVSLSGKSWTRQSWQSACGFTVLDTWLEKGGVHNIDANLNAQSDRSNAVLREYAPEALRSLAMLPTASFRTTSRRLARERLPATDLRHTRGDQLAYEGCRQRLLRGEMQCGLGARERRHVRRQLAERLATEGIVGIPVLGRCKAADDSALHAKGRHAVADAFLCRWDCSVDSSSQLLQRRTSVGADGCQVGVDGVGLCGHGASSVSFDAGGHVPGSYRISTAVGSSSSKS
jgi:hypothetical protein